MAHLNRGEHEEACRWAERGAREPNAHVLIWAIAALTHRLAGHAEDAASWADRAREQDPRLTPERFLRSFPFERAALRTRVAGALGELGF